MLADARNRAARVCHLTDWMGGTSTCCIALRACKSALIFAAAAAETISDGSDGNGSFCRILPAAAAGSGAALLFSAAPGERLDFPSGLRLRLDSVCLEDGDRERRSKRDCFRGSGSVWSKRDRFLGASSDILGDGRNAMSRGRRVRWKR